MTFTYSETLNTNLSWVRFHIGDTLAGSGPRLNNANFSDEELTALLTEYNENVNVVIAKIFGVLASEWTRMAYSYTIGPRREELSGIAKGYREKQIEWEELAGLGHRAFSSGTYRAGRGEDAGVN